MPSRNVRVSLEGAAVLDWLLERFEVRDLVDVYTKVAPPAGEPVAPGLICTRVGSDYRGTADLELKVPIDLDVDAPAEFATTALELVNRQTDRLADRCDQLRVEVTDA